jgi:hypothetical protein
MSLSTGLEYVNWIELFWNMGESDLYYVVNETWGPITGKFGYMSQFVWTYYSKARADASATLLNLCEA